MDSTDTVHRVLVVDDNVDAAQTLATLIELHGCKVRVAYGADQAVAAARAFRPSLALVDLVMPEVDGWALAPRLAQAAPGCLLVALSGMTSRSAVENSRAAGFSAHLFKPVSVESLFPLLLPRSA